MQKSQIRVAPRVAAAALAVALILTALWAGSAAHARSAADPPAANPLAKVAPQVLQATANGGEAPVVIMLAQQANLTAAYAMPDQDARGWYVYNTLRTLAASTQGPLQAYLKSEGRQFTSYWAANMIVTTADRPLVEALAARADVSHVDSNAPQRWVEPDSIANVQNAPDSPATVEWGVQNVNAPAVWALGYTGQGVVVASQDTGVRWTHNALKPQYRGWDGTTADHNYNWWDAIHDSTGNPCGNDSQQPCDDYFHGSHTTGSAVGSDGGSNQIGVAPGAQWMACRNMDQGTGTPARYSECFQFMIAPTDLAGQNPNPAMRPDVIINSWGCPTSEGCTTRAELEAIVNNTQAAGIFVEVSAGNSGPGCSSVTDPPAIYSAAFSTGAIDSSNTLAGFSSRGPSTYYTPNLLKPEVSAPGVNVRSASNSGDTAYTTASGTSMAGPHVVGVVALLWSARPQLTRMISETKTILENTANPNVIVSPVQTCGGTPSSQIPNNSFGYGRVDALAAVNSVPLETPTPTATGTLPTATQTSTPTITPTPTATVCGSSADYVYATATGAIVPGDTLVPGSQCDDCLAPVTLPFAYSLYGQSFTSAQVSSNGQLDFLTGDSQYANSCLPDTVASYAIFPNWDDLDTSGTGHGVYTSVTGVAPNRIFNIEWRAEYYPATGTANFEVRLYEGQSRFDLVYGTMSDAGNDATVGVQSDTGSHYTEFECNAGGLTSGLVVTFTQPGCGGTETPTPVPGTPTATATTGGPTSTPLPPTATATPAGCRPGPWTVANPRPAAVEGTTMDHDGTYAYAAGGYDGTDVTTYFVRYNPVADTWDTLTPMPTPADGTGVVYSPVNNKVYVFGGADGPGDAEDVTRIYDVAAGTWSLGAPMPGPRQRYAAVGYYNGKIYIVGGSTDLNGTSAQPNTWSYDPATDTWDTSLMDMPVALGEAAYGIVDGHIYVLGGKDNTQTTVDTVYDYDIASDTWATRASTEPLAVSQAGRAVVDGKIWVFGGDNGFFTRLTRPAGAPAVELSVTQIYDPSSDTWSPGPNLNVARYGVGGTYLAPYIISSAGYTSANEESVTEVIVDTCTTPTATPVAATATAAPPTATPVPGASSTPAPTDTPAAPTSTPVATETACPLPFSDVHDTDYFYVPVQYLYCHGVISGYADNTFRPYNATTRAQMVKIVVLGFGVPITTPAGNRYTFHDVPPSFPFFDVIETAAANNIISGYNCGGPGESCDSQNRPYFRPYNNVTRGQLSKIDVVAAGWDLQNPPTGSFTDVLPNTAFYTFVETAYCHGIISGYDCGGPGEPCDPQNRPYFRQGNDATRGQIAKIVYLSISGNPACVLPTATP